MTGVVCCGVFAAGGMVFSARAEAELDLAAGGCGGSGLGAALGDDDVNVVGGEEFTEVFGCECGDGWDGRPRRFRELLLVVCVVARRARRSLAA